MTTPIDVNDLTFGIEIETVIPHGTIAVGGYHNGRQIPGLPEGWKSERDCSIRCPAGHEACEVVSPILKGADGLRQVKQVCDWLNAVGAKVNRSTGMHVHVGWTGDPEALACLTHYVSNFEIALFASTGTRSREEGSYCRPIRANDDFTRRFRDATSDYTPTSRYHVLNLANLGEYRRNTVEFRVFAGTTNATKALGYIRMCLGLVERALTAPRKAEWDGKKKKPDGSIHLRRSGIGQSELTRLFYCLGWTKGRVDHTYGDIQPDGLPTLKETKPELMRLARKYDARVEGENDATPAQPWDAWDASTWETWERTLRPGRSIRVCLPDGTETVGQFRRRYPRNILVSVGEGTVLVPRFANTARARNNRIHPSL
jgi:hypothetical protein